MQISHFISNDALTSLLFWSIVSAAILLVVIITVILIIRLNNNRLERLINCLYPQFETLCLEIESTKDTTDLISQVLTSRVFPVFERFLRNKIADISEISVHKYREVSELSGFSEYLRYTINKSKGYKRAIALRTLTYLRNPSDILLLQKILENETFYPSVYTAGLGLALCKNTESFSRILHILCARKTDNRDDILVILTAFGEGICPSIVEHLVSFRDSTQTVLIDFLRLYGYRPAQKLLEELVVASPSLEARIHAIEALGVLGNQDSLLLLQPFLMNEDFRIRLKTVVALAKIGGKKFLPQLLLMLEDPEWWVRRNAAEAFYGLGEDGIKELKKIGSEATSERGRMARMVIDELKFGRIRWRYRFAESFS